MIDDGFGNYYPKYCLNCGAELEIVRPGKVQCSESCHLEDFDKVEDYLNQ